MSDTAQDRVILGRVQGLFGVRGWLKLYSYTSPPENILAYSHWELHNGIQWQRMRVADGRRQGKGLVAQLAGEDDTPISDRESAARWLDADVAVLRSELPPLAADEYYGAELLGLRVITAGDEDMGTVSGFIDTGANPVMAVHGERERLIPFIRDLFILEVDRDAGLIKVDWDPDF